MKKSVGVYNGTNLYLTVGTYFDNGRIYLGLETEDELYADITINLSDRLIEDDNCIVIPLGKDGRAYGRRHSLRYRHVQVPHLHKARYRHGREAFPHCRAQS